jgi:hypothetical protein
MTHVTGAPKIIENRIFLETGQGVSRRQDLTRLSKSVLLRAPAASMSGSPQAKAPDVCGVEG